MTKDKFREIRKRGGFTAESLADYLGVSVSMIYKIEAPNVKYEPNKPVSRLMRELEHKLESMGK